MTKLEPLLPSTSIRGILPDASVTVVNVQRQGSDALTLIYRSPSGRAAEEILYRSDEHCLEVLKKGRPGASTGTRRCFASSPRSTGSASRISSIPYSRLGAHVPRRAAFLTRSRPSTRPCFHASRSDFSSPTTPWQGIPAISMGGPLHERAHRTARREALYRLLSRKPRRAVAARVPPPVRDPEELQAGSGTHAQLVPRERPRPPDDGDSHNGKEEHFQLFLALLDGDRFEGRFRDGVHQVEVSDLIRRMVKESRLKFDGRPLFPERIARTTRWSASGSSSSPRWNGSAPGGATKDDNKESAR